MTQPTEPRAARVWRRNTIHKVPPIKPDPNAWRAPRMGNAPVFRSGSMASVYQELVRYGAKSSAVSYRSYESNHYPK